MLIFHRRHSTTPVLHNLQIFNGRGPRSNRTLGAHYRGEILTFPDTLTTQGLSLWCFNIVTTTQHKQLVGSQGVNLECTRGPQEAASSAANPSQQPPRTARSLELVPTTRSPQRAHLNCP